MSKEADDEVDVLKGRKLMTRREALSTAGKMTIGAAAVVVIGGVSYVVYQQIAAPKPLVVPPPAQTVVQTQTVTVPPATQIVTKTVAPEEQIWITYVDNSSTGKPDPALGSDIPGLRIYSNIYDNLVKYDTKTPANIAPNVATDWKVSSDGLQYTFNIRKGIKFHDGSELDAEAVRFTMDRIMTMNLGIAFMWQGVIKPTTTEVLDKYSVRFKLENPYGPFLATLPYLMIVSPKTIKERKADGPYGEWGNYASKWLLDGNDAGSGPYILKNFKVEQSFDFERFNDYWGGWQSNQIYGMHFIKVAEEATIKMMFGAGLSHITGGFRSTEFVQWAAANPDTKVTLGAFPFDGHYIFMNTTKPPFDDISFRKGISCLFPYEDFLTKIRGGIGDKRLIGPLPRAYWGHNGDIKPYELDVNKAKEYFSQSKYSDLKGVRELAFSYINVIEFERLAGLGMQAEAAKLGLKINVVSLPWAQYVDRVAKPELAPDLVAVTLAGYYADPDALLYNAWHSFPSESITWSRDPTHYKNLKVDKLLDDARSTTDQKARTEMYKEVQAIVNDEAPAIFAMEQVGYTPHSAKLKGIVWNVQYFNYLGLYGLRWEGPPPK